MNEEQEINQDKEAELINEFLEWSEMEEYFMF